MDGDKRSLNEDLSLIKETSLMNEDRMEGKWKQMKGGLKSRWGKLTDDDLDVIEGQKDQLVGKVQERYGIAKDEAQKQVDEWNRINRDAENRDVEAERQLLCCWETSVRGAADSVLFPKANLGRSIWTNHDVLRKQSRSWA